MKVIYLFISLVLVSGCLSNKLTINEQKVTQPLTAEINHDEKTYSIILHNHSKDTLRVGATFRASGFHAIITDESDNVVYDTRGIDFNHFNSYIMPFESFAFMEKASIGELLAITSKVKKSGNYTITCLNEKYSIHESFTVYFDYEKFMKNL